MMHFFLSSDFYFLPPFAHSSFMFRMSFSALGAVESAAQVAGQALDASVKQPAGWESSGACFGVGLVELGSTGLALS